MGQTLQINKIQFYYNGFSFKQRDLFDIISRFEPKNKRAKKNLTPKIPHLLAAAIGNTESIERIYSETC